MQDYTPTILLVDDEENCLKVIKDVFDLEGIACITANNGARALELLDRNDVDIVISDIKMPGMSGLELLKKVKAISPETFVIMMTGYGSIRDAIQSIKHGAFHYIIKPIVMDDFIAQIKEIIEQIKNGKTASHAHIDYLLKNKQIIGESSRIKSIRELIKLVSTANLPALISGESGTGKEMAAFSIHQNSPRQSHDFCTIHCASFADDALENKIFGRDKEPGKSIIAHAEGGTIYLDEISNCNTAVQNRLLELLETGNIKITGSATHPVNVRIIASTSVDLHQMAINGQFNPTLYYLLSIIHLQMPALREIKKDIPLLATFFAGEFAARFGLGDISISNEALARLQSYYWPGNVRELLNLVRTAVSVCEEKEIQIFDLPSRLSEPDEKQTVKEIAKPKTLLMDEVEKEHILRVLKMANGNKSQAADIMGIHRDTLLRKLKKYKVDE